MTAPVAAIDCGTNSTRLLIVDGSGAALDRRMLITRMGDGVDRNHRLSPEAIDRTLAALGEYGLAMEELGVERRRAVATSAARDADNREDFIAAAEQVIGVRPELLSGQEEGALSYAGATAELNASAGPYLVLDIGGGSTELVLGERAVSLDIGCVRMSERFFHADPPHADQITAARELTAGLLETARVHLGDPQRASRLIGLAGTVSTAAMIDAGFTSYRREEVHHRGLGRESVRRILESMAGMDHDQRAAIPGLEPGRVDVILGGLLVLLTVMEDFGFEDCLVSESDILDGIAAGLLAS
ncbi:MAG TPA: exopolyphosphatase [Acidimicrobiales bacterium]|nr:exopolyphosphatase [Acidimicrobiales bacterium]